MNVNDVKIGETFSQNGILYKKTTDGVIRLDTERNVHVPAGEVIIERQILRG